MVKNNCECQLFLFRFYFKETFISTYQKVVSLHKNIKPDQPQPSPHTDTTTVQQTVSLYFPFTLHCLTNVSQFMCMAWV